MMQLLLNWQTLVGGDDVRPSVVGVAPVVLRELILRH